MNGQSETESVCTDFADLTKRDQPQPVGEVKRIALLDECVHCQKQPVRATQYRLDILDIFTDVKMRPKIHVFMNMNCELVDIMIHVV